MSQIGIYGMGVMGSNLAVNLSTNGYSVAIFNRSPEAIDNAVAKFPGQNWQRAHDLEQFVSMLQRPRKIILMIAAGVAVDRVIQSLSPLLETGDIIMDGGNSFFKDTQRRHDALSEKGIHYIGLGISGGETGARLGPALMPGGDKLAYEQVRGILERIAAKANDQSPCCYYLGTGGAGHFVKMVHNGIEYADMALIAELYWLLKYQGYPNQVIAELFEEFNRGPLQSYLIEISAKILREKDPYSDADLIDLIRDVAMQKGTGKWTMQESIDLGVDCSVLGAGLNQRFMSTKKEERIRASEIYPDATLKLPKNNNENTKLIPQSYKKQLENALYAAKIIAYAQGFSLYSEADKSYKWQLSLENIAATFRAGCIIRAALLEPIRASFKDDPKLANLLLSSHFSDILKDSIPSLRAVVSQAISLGQPVPTLASALHYFDAYRQKDSAAKLIQAQRDFFGAHRFERIDKAGDFHHQWEE
ncbi:MAG: NADP-dependent phosphogluconate dehydrogenase [Bradymonadia bacterium]|jgi:6-phosphogluconate dehydrogenase